MSIIIFDKLVFKNLTEKEQSERVIDSTCCLCLGILNLISSLNLLEISFKEEEKKTAFAIPLSKVNKSFISQ